MDINIAYRCTREKSVSKINNKLNNNKNTARINDSMCMSCLSTNLVQSNGSHYQISVEDDFICINGTSLNGDLEEVYFQPKQLMARGRKLIVKYTSELDGKAREILQTAEITMHAVDDKNNDTVLSFSFPGTWPMESRVRGSPETEPREQLPMLQEFFKQNVTRGRLIERIVKTSDVQSTNTNSKRKIYSYEYSVENKKHFPLPEGDKLAPSTQKEGRFGRPM